MVDDGLMNEVSQGKLPFHVAITLTGINKYLRRYNKELGDVLASEFEKIKNIIYLQIKLGVPILTVHLMGADAAERASYSLMVDNIIRFIEELKESRVFDQNQIKVSALGKWYNLPDRAVELIKETVTETKDYDQFFLNLCILYDGKQEIRDSLRILGRKIKSDDLDPDSITEDDIKENIYSSSLMPPDLIIKTGKQHRLNGFLLWDSVNAYIYFPHKYSPECTEEDFLRGIAGWQEAKKDLLKHRKD